MFQSLFAWFNNDELMPHGMCFLWEPHLLWLHAVSDTLIAASYYGIPVAVLFFALRRKDLVFRHVFLLSGLFVLACGTTHAFGVWVLWNPDYAIQGAIKAATAVISLTALAATWRVMPAALVIPSPSQLQEANDALESEIAERRRVDAQLTQLNHELEARVAERTAELEAANAALQRQVAREQLLVKEIHHRVKNNLQTMSSMLRLQADSVGPELASAFATAQRRIAVMAEIHEELYQADGAGTVDFGGYLEKLCAGLSAFYDRGEQVAIQVQADRLCVDLDQATPLALIANEAVANACEHAFPEAGTGTISVTLRRHGDDAELLIEDDGIGLGDADLPDQSSGSMGSLIMSALTEQIGGRLEIVSEGGTRVYIRFRVEEAETT